MAGIGIVTDSSICLPEEIIEKYGIVLVPEVIVFGDKTYRDGADLTHREFYTLLRKSRIIPTTSAPSPEDFRDAFNMLTNRDVSHILCILVTSNFSNMGFKSAQVAREAFSHFPIDIIDSRCAVGAYGLIVLEAARVAAYGRSLPEIINVIEDIRSRITTILTLNTLKYLAKGGRIGKAAFWAGKILNVKPIIEIPPSSGAIEPLERVRTRSNALIRLLDLMEKRTGTSKSVHVSIDHGNAPEEAEWLKHEIMSRFNCIELYVNYFAPVAGVHCGPGVIAVSFYTS